MVAVEVVSKCEKQGRRPLTPRPTQPTFARCCPGPSHLFNCPEQGQHRDTLASRDWNADLTVEEGLFQMLLVGNSPSSTVRSAFQSLEGLVFCEPSCTENQYT